MSAPRLLWMTNIPTPYRACLWDALGDSSRLTVACMARTEPNRSWGDVAGARFDLDIVDAPSVRVAPLDLSLYLPSAQVGRLVRRPWDALVVDGWESPVYWYLLAQARRRSLPVVACYRSTAASHRFQRGAVARMRRCFLRSVDAVLTAGPASTAAVAAAGVPGDRVVVGFNAVDVGSIHRGAAAARERRPAGDGHRFIYVGQLIERKNVAGAIDAFARMRRDGDTFTIVGTGPLDADLRTLTAQLGLDGVVRFAGGRDGAALVDELGGADTLVLPSTQEVWGLVVNEALAAGLHVVVSSACGVAPSVQHMAGVFVADLADGGLEWQMAASRRAWTGPIGTPEMLRHTPARAADAVIESVAVATRAVERRRNGGRSGTDRVAHPDVVRPPG